MNKLVSFPLGDGNVVWVEIDEIDDPSGALGESEASRAGELATQATQTFQDVIDSVRPVAETIVQGLDKISDRPNEISVEFGLKLNGKVGTVIAASGIEANFKVTLKWQHDRNEK